MSRDKTIYKYAYKFLCCWGEVVIFQCDPFVFCPPYIRLKACKELGIDLVPIMIRDDLTDENEKLKLLLAANFGRTKNDDAKQRKIATEYVALCGYKNGGDRTAQCENRTLLTQSEIASQLGVSERTLKEMLAIERKLTPEIKDLLDTGVFTKTTASKILTKLSPDEQKLNIEISENEVRKDFSKAERVEYARRLEKIESVKARERMATSTGGANPRLVETFPQAEGKVRDVVAEKVGIGSGKQYEKEKYIVDNADTLTPKDFANWDEGKLSTNKAYLKIKEQLAEKENQIAGYEAKMKRVDELKAKEKAQEINPCSVLFYSLIISSCDKLMPVAVKMTFSST